MMIDKIHISGSNSKIGKTGNISLLPVVTCPPGVPCARDCYARKHSPGAMKAWQDNTAFAMNDVFCFFMDIQAWLKDNKPKFFRWHVSGDVPSAKYCDLMKMTARDFPKIKFLVFTKQYKLDWMDFGSKIPNLTVYHSAWPGIELPTKTRRDTLGVDAVAYIEGDERIPKGTQKCKGSCDKCRFCWNIGKDVVLYKH